MSEDGQNTANSSDSVQLTIRCAFQTAADQTVDVLVNWTVRKLKEHIHEVHPSHPAVSSQRLIYCGGCLTDERVLRDVFQQSPLVTDGPTVIHMACPLPQTNPEIRRRTNASSNQNATPEAQQPVPTYQAYMQQAYYPTPPNLDPSSQEAYAQYYQNYMGYLQAYQSSMMAAMRTPNYNFPHPVFVQNAPGMPAMPYFANVGNAQPINLTGANNQAVVLNPHLQVPAAAADQQQQAAHVADRGVGGMVEDGMEMFYKGVRVVFLLMTVLLYTSLDRFLIVLGIVLLLLFTQMRRAHNRRIAAEAQPVNNNNAGEQQEQAENHGDGEHEGEGSDASEAAPEAPPANPNSGLQVFFATCYSFVTSFIASLVPDHIPVDVN